MSYYENNFNLNNVENFNNLEEGFDNNNSYYYLSETANDHNLNGMYYEHMEGQVAPTPSTVEQPKPAQPKVEQPKVEPKKVKKESNLSWLNTLVIFLIIAIVLYYLIDNDFFDFGSSSAVSSSMPKIAPSMRQTLGNTFISLY